MKTVKRIGLDLLKAFSPNVSMNPMAYGIMVMFQLLIGYYFWVNSSEVIPRPMEILGALPKVMENGLLAEIWVSTKLALHAILISFLITAIVVYGTVLPWFRPMSFLFTKFRYMTTMGLSFLFTVITGGGYDLKLYLMVYGVTVFFITTMAQSIKDIHSDEYKYSRSLRMNEWQVSFYTVVWGRLEALMEGLRQNFAICWMMLTMVEGLVRSEGGIGTVLLNDNKHMALDNIFAIQLVLLFIGIVGDYLLGVLKYIVCPHTNPNFKLKKK